MMRQERKKCPENKRKLLDSHVPENKINKFCLFVQSKFAGTKQSESH
jgi:hypothetical protein